MRTTRTPARISYTLNVEEVSLAILRYLDEEEGVPLVSGKTHLTLFNLYSSDPKSWIAAKIEVEE